MRKRFIALAATAMALCLPMNSMAAEYFLEDGDICIQATADTQTVIQEDKTIVDLNPVIKNRNSGTATANKIEIKSDDDAVANVTIKDINIETDSDTADNGIRVVKKSSALITLAGVNTIKSNNGYAAVRVYRGRLGITGDGTLNVEATSTFNEMNALIQGAAIGTDSNEDLQGSITIGGNAIVNAKVLEREEIYNKQEAAAIGTGADGSISETGLIAIIDNAKVNASAIGDGAGIGAGVNGDQHGAIIVKDEADVTAISMRDGAGIGTSERSDLGKNGLILITGKSKVLGKSAQDGAGIGVGRKGNLYGKIIINGESQADLSADYQGVGLGGGEKAKMMEESCIVIGDKAKVVATGKKYSTGIGTGEKGTMAGNTIVQDEADVKAISSGSAAAVGTDEPGAMTGTIQVIGNSKLVTGVNGNPTANGMIGGGSEEEIAANGTSNSKFVIGENATINGITANSEANLVDILGKFAEIESLDAANYTQVESPADLLVYNAKADQAKLPVSKWNTPVEPEVPGGSDNNDNNNVPSDPDNNDNNNVPGDPDNNDNNNVPGNPDNNDNNSVPGNPDNNVSDESKGSVDNNSVVIKTPETASVGTVRTGDSANVTLLMLMLACSLFSIYGVRKHRSKR